MISHSVSLTNGVLMAPIYHTTWVLLGALKPLGLNLDAGDIQTLYLPLTSQIPAR
jgi:hypothetical protein